MRAKKANKPTYQDVNGRLALALDEREEKIGLVWRFDKYTHRRRTNSEYTLYISDADAGIYDIIARENNKYDFVYKKNSPVLYEKLMLFRDEMLKKYRLPMTD